MACACLIPTFYSGARLCLSAPQSVARWHPASAGHRETTALRDFSPAYDRCGSNLRRKDPRKRRLSAAAEVMTRATSDHSTVPSLESLPTVVYRNVTAREAQLL